MTFGSFIPTVTYAYESNEAVDNSYEIQMLEDELRFYFEKVGYLDDKGNYHITNTEPLEKRANSGDINAQILLDMHTYKTQTLGGKRVCDMYS